jgi:hypothetical protein
MVVLGLQGVGGGHGISQVDAAQEQDEGWNLVAFPVDLSLGGDLAAVGHGGDQDGGRPLGVAGATECLTVDGDDLSSPEPGPAPGGKSPMA